MGLSLSSEPSRADTSSCFSSDLTKALIGDALPSGLSSILTVESVTSGLLTKAFMGECSPVLLKVFMADSALPKYFKGWGCSSCSLMSKGTVDGNEGLDSPSESDPETEVLSDLEWEGDFFSPFLFFFFFFLECFCFLVLPSSFSTCRSNKSNEIF